MTWLDDLEWSGIAWPQISSRFATGCGHKNFSIHYPHTLADFDHWPIGARRRSRRPIARWSGLSMPVASRRDLADVQVLDRRDGAPHADSFLGIDRRVTHRQDHG